jgi:hypothetical protein
LRALSARPITPESAKFWSTKKAASEAARNFHGKTIPHRRQAR